MEEVSEARVLSFLLELSDLTARHKIVIGGCGCCGSPSLYELREEDLGPYAVKANLDDLEYMRRDSNKYFDGTEVYPKEPKQ